MRLWYLLHEALTETTLVQPIMLSYHQPNSMLYSRGTVCNTYIKINTRELNRVPSTKYLLYICFYARKYFSVKKSNLIRFLSI